MKKIFTKTLLFLSFIFFLSTPAMAQDQDENALNELISKNKKDYVAITKLGVLYQDQGRKAEAGRHFKKAIEIAPDYPDAHLYIGRFYFLERDFDKAVEELKTYKNIMKALPEMDEQTKKMYINDLFYLSEVYFTLKRYTEAREELEEILKLNPSEPRAYYNLGVYYYVYEHSRSKAYNNFKKAIEVGPSSEAAKSAEYAIEFIRSNPDSRFAPDFSFIDRE
ncbi:MAG: tetratricopeptide repeat protein [Candidatus Omnitrophica bacterium]|nr:tetratricopeptide repeat protein [Candidatus Omnitrophota bacterium]